MNEGDIAFGGISMTPTAPFALTVTVSIGCAQSGCDAHHEYPKVWVY